MVRYQQGDQTAATALVHTVSGPLHRFFLVHTVSRRHADDLLQETWLRIHRARHTYRPGEPVLPWIYAIARHVRVDHYRRVHRIETREQQVEQLPEVAQNSVGRSGAGPDLAALLAGLPDSQREVITMLKVLNMPIEEVARATSSSVGSVKQKAHRAYVALRERLAGAKGPK
ncbi:MAG TPA: RNA polymerase sigma factor [Candidatus Acidoferrales bacterium]|nr:RNA polymerase sigma factor [Candidatus Acidoferrales bacterium]